MISPNLRFHGLIPWPPSHTAEAALEHAGKRCSLARNRNACLGSSAGAAQPVTGMRNSALQHEPAPCHGLTALNASKAALPVS